MAGFETMSTLKPESYDKYIAGTVVENNDPLKKQRIKVEVPGLLEGSPSQLPWIAPKLFSPFVVHVPDIGDKVIVYFQDSDIHYGLSEGYLHVEGKEIPSELLENYPHRRGWFDPYGNYGYTDSDTGVKVYKHKDDVFTSVIDADGNVTITMDGNKTLTIQGNVNIVVQGAATVNVTGNVDLTSDGNINLQASQINLN